MFAIGLVAILGIILALNVGGWRARILARLFRVDNYPVVAAPPPGFHLQLPPGFKASIFARGFARPRWLAIALNGDLFVADSSAGQIVVLGNRVPYDKPESRTIFADHLNLPFGIAFHENFVYVANTDSVVRFPYDPTTSKRLGQAEPILALPGYGYNQHWTRSLAFSADGNTLFVAVGSKTNVSVESDPRRAAILAMTPDGRKSRVYASGLRNAVGLAINPGDGRLWATVNERDDIGDDIPSDYFTHLFDAGFYGWPYSYLGQHVDNRVAARPDLVKKALVPDLLLGAHVAPLQFAFYDQQQFPLPYQQGAFIAEHGSWNRRIRSGYQVVFVPFRAGATAGEPQPFLTGLVPDRAGTQVYGRPFGIAVGLDGSLFVSDDGGNILWRVTYYSRDSGAEATTH